MTSIEFPFVSVIVPVYNGAGTIHSLLSALAEQDYPPNRREIILIDNGSDDGTKEIIALRQNSFQPPLVVLEERETRGSYAARNLGLKAARGEIIAFTDADCTPVRSWITEGVHCIQQTGADLAGGQVTFTFASDNPTAAEIIDSQTNMQMETDVHERGVTKTANMFVKRHVFDAIGVFPSHLQSGGDVMWTGLATRHGFQLVFSAKAEVHHPARSWRELFVKQIRVGRGQIPVMLERGMTWKHILIDSSRVRRRARSNKAGTSAASLPKKAPPRLLLALAWSRGATLLGRILGLLDGRSRLRG
jgi:glycosyltransferase AglE